MRTVTAAIVAALLSGIPIVAQQPVQSPQQPPASAQPPVSRPPAEQMPAPTPTPTETPTAPTVQITGVPGGELDRSTATGLLERIESIVNDALQDESSKDKKDKEKNKASTDSKAVATSGKLEGKLENKAGKVTIDRADLNEILAEVALLKTMIRR